MEDVEKKINSVCDRLKEQVRTELNNLTGSYLRDVIRGEADVYDMSLINSLDENNIQKILARVEEKTINDRDKKHLLDVIAKLKTKSQKDLNVREKYLAHFFSKLIDIYKGQENREESIRQFVNVCNRYLENKELFYDEINYTIITRMEDKTPIKFQHLSSGEKQIVSLFSHLYLGEGQSYFILFDEPELSLSVEWQKTFLPDIMASDRCRFLAAVTHSPFIFDNELDAVAKDLKECIKAAE